MTTSYFTSNNSSGLHKFFPINFSDKLKDFFNLPIKYCACQDDPNLGVLLKSNSLTYDFRRLSVVCFLWLVSELCC